MLSVVIPWYNRYELQTVIPSIIESVNEIGGDITIVNLGGDVRLLENQILEYKEHVKVIQTAKQKTFNKPIAQNIGAFHAKNPYLFFCDCDIIFPPGTLISLFDRIREGNNLFGTIASVKETEVNARKANCLVMFGYELHLKISDGTEVKIIDNEEDVNKGTRQAPGLLMVKKTDFEKIDGYNSQLDGWGWEDQDIICRLTLGGKLSRLCLGDVHHLSHSDEVRMQGYHNYQTRWESRDKMFRRALDNYDKGCFMGSYSHDIKRHINAN